MGGKEWRAGGEKKEFLALRTASSRGKKASNEEEEKQRCLGGLEKLRYAV